MKSSIVILLSAVLLTTGCAKEANEPAPDPISAEDKSALETRYNGLLARAKEIRNQENGWIEEDCDGMLWTGKYAASSRVTGVDIKAAGADEPGSYYRRPGGDCGDQWSRDMGLGFIVWAYRNRQLSALVAHAEYGKANNWKMGRGDGRNIYTPQMIGHLYQAIHALGGEDNANRKWPVVYTKGLDDYQAHLQMLTISLRYEIDRVTEGMVKRIKEHAEREPSCGFYQVMAGTYSGDYSRAIKILREDDKNLCQYVRCSHGGKGCKLAEDIWSLDLLLGRIEGNDG